MILLLHTDTDKNGEDYRQLMAFIENLDNIQARVHDEVGAQQMVTEIYLVGDTAALSVEDMQSFTCVERVVRVSEEYRVLGRHHDDKRATHFDYNGVRFGQDNLNVFAGLCAVDTPEHVEIMMQALKEHGQACTRMGAYRR
jgi:3-deoxy-7-phosphoheptulonate synthase